MSLRRSHGRRFSSPRRPCLPLAPLGHCSCLEGRIWLGGAEATAISAINAERFLQQGLVRFANWCLLQGPAILLPQVSLAAMDTQMDADFMIMACDVCNKVVATCRLRHTIRLMESLESLKC